MHSKNQQNTDNYNANKALTKRRRLFIHKLRLCFLIKSVNTEIRTIPLRVGAVDLDTFSDASHIHHWSSDLPLGR